MINNYDDLSILKQ